MAHTCDDDCDCACDWCNTSRYQQGLERRLGCVGCTHFQVFNICNKYNITMPNETPVRLPKCIDEDGFEFASPT